jgi:hypothetical protein
MKNFKELAESKEEVYELGAVVSKLQEFTTRYLFCVNRVIPLLMSKDTLDEHERGVLTGFVMSLHSDIFPMLTGIAKYVDPYCAELLVEAASETVGNDRGAEGGAEADFNRAASGGFVYRPPENEGKKEARPSRRKASSSSTSPKKKGTETGYTRGKTKKEGETDNANGRKGRRRKGGDDPGD